MKQKKSEIIYELFVYIVILSIPTIITIVCYFDKPTPSGTNDWIKWIIVAIFWIINIALIIYLATDSRSNNKLQQTNNFQELKILEIIDEEELLDIEVEISIGEEKKKLLTTYISKNKISNILKQKMEEKGVYTIKTWFKNSNPKKFKMDLEDFLTKLDMKQEIPNIEEVGTGCYDYSKSVKDTLK